ncbi:mate-domain-containing protein [Ramicandelaber brevisporus]|nr:mate-domain-containing protein [Ramicandelaber brevisporus]
MRLTTPLPLHAAAAQGEDELSPLLHALEGETPCPSENGEDSQDQQLFSYDASRSSKQQQQQQQHHHRSTEASSLSVPSVWAETWSAIEFATPLSYAAALLAYLPIIAVESLGHFGKEALAAYATSRMINTILVMGPMLGTSTALETLCSQSYTGSDDPRAVGYWLQRLIVIITIMFVVCEVLLWNCDWLVRLVVFGALSEEGIHQTVVLVRLDILLHYISVLMNAVKRFLFAQKIKAANVIGLTLAVPVCMVSSYYLVKNPTTSLGLYGAPISVILAFLTILFTMIGYVIATGQGRAAWGGWSWREAMREWKLFGTLGVPAAFTTTIEYGFQEFIAVGAARLDPVALAVHPIASTLIRLAVNTFTRQVGVVNTAHIGHSLGDANAKRANRVSNVGTAIGTISAVLAAVILLVFRQSIVEHYTNQAEVIALMLELFPVVAACVLFLGMNNALDGVMRGQGRQYQALWFKIVAFYLVALPAGYYLAFVTPYYGVKGLWSGLALGAAATAILQLWWILTTDWDAEVVLCQQRLGNFAVEDEDDEEAMISDAATIRSFDQRD